MRVPVITFKSQHSTKMQRHKPILRAANLINTHAMGNFLQVHISPIVMRKANFLSSQEAFLQLTNIINHKPTSYNLVPFETYNQVHKLQSPKYDPFYLFCKDDTMQSGALMVCKYLLSGGCRNSNAILTFKTTSDRTGRLYKVFQGKIYLHMAQNKSDNTSIARTLPVEIKSEINNTLGWQSP